MNYKYFINDELYADLNEEKAFLDLSEIIKCKTISNPNQELMDFNEFDKLHNILKHNFPLVVKNSEIEIINKGSILNYNLVSLFEGDEIEGLYYDGNFKNEYDNKKIENDIIVHVKIKKVNVTFIFLNNKMEIYIL